MNPKSATATDYGVGIRIATLRKAKGLSQTALGTAIGVTFQQVQKYEKGTNRVGASRLQQIAQMLDVQVSTFFSDDENASEENGFAFMSSEGALDLLRAYVEIEDEQLRRDVIAIVRIAARMGLPRSN